jgi:hypothetical protein
MIRVAALIAGVALVASGCGGAEARSAADVAPADLRAFVSVPAAPLDAVTRRALALTQDGSRLQAIVDRAGWARLLHRRVELAQLGDGRLVAFARLKDDKVLDAAGLEHTRTRGWTIFAPTKDAVRAARAKRHLTDTRWYPRAAEAAGSSGTTLVAPGWLALAAESGTARRSSPGRGTDTPTAAVPADVIAASASQDGAGLLRSRFAAGVQEALGLPLDRLTQLTPAGAVLYVRPGMPIPLVTLLAEKGSPAAARRVVRTVAPNAPPPVREQVNELSLDHVGLGATDLYFGKAGRTLVFSDDPQVSLRGQRLTPAGVPSKTSSWLYVDGRRARASLQVLTALHAAHAQRALAGLESLVAYETHEQGVATSTVVVSEP